MSDLTGDDAPSDYPDVRPIQIGYRFRLPQRALERDVVYQFVSSVETAKAHGWMPTDYREVWGDAGHDGSGHKVTVYGHIEVCGLTLVERSKKFAQLSAEDERIKPLVLNVIASRALAGNAAIFDGGSVRNAWQETKDAYDDTAFRNANREAIVQRAYKLARRVGQTPELLVSVEPPVPCRLEGMQLWFFNEGRCIPIWRLFEPLAIVQLKDEQP